MKINQIISETTTSGSVASVATPMGKVQKRAGSLFKGKKTNKPFYEAELQEDDLILVPGQGHKLKSGFIPHDLDRRDHEVEMARSDLYNAAKNAKEIYQIVQNVSEDEGLDGWVQEKIIKANDYLNSVREYLEHKIVQQESNLGGVVAGGGVGEGVAEGLGKSIKRGMAGWGAFDKDKPADVVKRVKGQDTDTLKGLSRTGPTGRGSPAELQQKAISRELKKRGEQGVAEGAKVDRMVQHIKKSEIKSGKSAEEAEDIAWATVNKRGYLDNKNKKKAK